MAERRVPLFYPPYKQPRFSLHLSQNVPYLERTLFVLMYGRNQERRCAIAHRQLLPQNLGASLTRRNTRRYSVPWLLPWPRKEAAADQPGSGRLID